MTKILTLLLLFCLLPLTGYSATIPFVLTDKQQNYSLKFDILEDKTGHLTIADMQKTDIAKRFFSVTTPSVNYSFTKNVYWVKFEIQNQAKAVDKWYLSTSELTRIHLTNI